MEPPLSVAERARLASVLGGAGVPDADRLVPALITAGKSNVTIRLSNRHGSWVLRMPPRHGRTPSAHDVAREFRVTSALAGTGVPVAPPVLLCEDESVIGGPFAVAGFVDGSCIQTRRDLVDLDDGALAGVVDALVGVLAGLHRVDHRAVGLDRFGRPDGYAERQLRRWTGQWQLVRPGDPDLDRAAAELGDALVRTPPRQRATGIVHGDYRIDNTLLRLDTGRLEVSAVVDWELSTIGDPVADVAMMCGYRHPALDQILATDAAWASDRLPDVASLAGSYEESGGVELVDFDAHLALAYFKTAVIAAGIDHRNRAAEDSAEPGVTAGRAVEPLLEAGLAALRGAL